MATVNKDFKIKNGLIVEGANGTINGYDILTKDSEDQAYIVGLIGGSANSQAVANTVVARDANASFAANVITADTFIAQTELRTDRIEINSIGVMRDDDGDLVISTTVDGDDVILEADDIRLNAIDDVLITSGNEGSSAGDIVLTTNGGDIRLQAADVFLGTNINYTDAERVATRGYVDDAINDIDLTFNTDEVSEGTSNLYFSNARARDALVYPITSGTHSNITIGYDAIAGTFSFEAENGVSDSTTDDLDEGNINLYFSNVRVHNTISAGEGLNYNGSGQFSAHLGYGLEFANNAIRVDADVIATDIDVSGAIDAHNVSSGVHGVTGNVVGTSDAQTISNKTLGSNLDAGTYTITNLGTPNNSTDAATKAYVDGVAEGLHIHASVVAATTANINLTTDVEAGDFLDGVLLQAGNRILVKDQNTASQNGIYVVQASGAAVRAADFDAPAEVDGGDFVFVTGGDNNADTGWVQTSELVATIGIDPIYFTQFSGAGTFLAGYGLYLDGNTFNANANVLASLTYVGDAVSDHSDATTGVHGVSGNVVGTSDTQTLSNKTLGTGVVLGADLDAVNTYKIVNLEDPTSNQDAATKFYVDSEISGLGNTVNELTSDDIAEGNINLYFTNARVEAALVNVDTDDIFEGTNLYFTNNRAQAAMVTPLTSGTQTNITVTYNGLTGNYDFVAENGVDDSTTDDLDEGTNNLYFTNNRAVAAMITPLTTGVQTNISVTYDAMTGKYDFVAENGVAESDTDDLLEGTSNLYFTNARAIAALEAVTPNFTEIDINSIATQIAATTGNIATASQVTAYSWPKASYRSAEFLVKTAYSTHTEVSKVILTMDTSDNIAITEYAIVGTNGSASTITADIDNSVPVPVARLRVTTLNNNSTVTIVGTLLV